MENETHKQLQKTPLYEAHVEAGAKLVDFHGWLLPIQYGGILQEHESVRTGAGLFDVSHMGEIEVSGPDSLEFLQFVLTNDIDAKPGKAVYSPMCYPNGGAVDDLLVYKLDSEQYLLVVNASNVEKDYQWLLDNKKGRITISNRSAEYAQLALQGPKAKNIMQQLLVDGLGELRSRHFIEELRNYHFVNEVTAGSMKILLSRTGYTGEDGFELYCRPEDAKNLWKLLLDKGKAYGLVPVGLGARDTLRLESAMPLYGQELSESITPLAAGLQRFIKPDKGEFIGRGALLEQMNNGLKQKIVGFEMLDRAIPRNGYEVLCNGKNAGYVTSGGFFPTLKKNMGLALLNTEYSNEGNTIDVKVREGLYAAKIAKLPFYKR